MSYGAVVCSSCGRRAAAFQCGGCAEQFYCGRGCQRAHWLGEHHSACGARPIGGPIRFDYGKYVPPRAVLKMADGQTAIVEKILGQGGFGAVVRTAGAEPEAIKLFDIDDFGGRLGYLNERFANYAMLGANKLVCADAANCAKRSSFVVTQSAVPGDGGLQSKPLAEVKDPGWATMTFPSPKFAAAIDMLVFIGQVLAPMKRANKSNFERALLSLARDFTADVALLHENRIAHSDIKPSNVIVEGGALKWQTALIDFGLSKMFGLSDKIPELAALLTGGAGLMKGAKAVVDKLVSGKGTPQTVLFGELSIIVDRVPTGTRTHFDPVYQDAGRDKKAVSEKDFYALDTYAVGVTLFELSNAQAFTSQDTTESIIAKVRNAPDSTMLASIIRDMTRPDVGNRRTMRQYSAEIGALVDKLK